MHDIQPESKQNQETGFTMKGITLHQPWANFIINGTKKIETRTRRTHIRGTVFIHASKQYKNEHWNPILVKDNGPYEEGAIIGTVDIIDCVPVEVIRHTLSNQELALGGYDNGRYAWILSNPVKYDKPIPAKGKQGWWTWKQD